MAERVRDMKGLTKVDVRDIQDMLDENDRLRALVVRLIEVYAPHQRKKQLLAEMEGAE